MNTWTQRARAWLHEHTRPPDDEARPSPQDYTDAEVITTWARWEDGPMLDLPLKPYASMSKTRVWDIFVRLLADHEAKGILQDEQFWGPPKRSTLNAATLQPLTAAEADAEHGRLMAWWNENQEAPLRPSDSASAVSVWLWRNGLHDQAVGAFSHIWMAVRAEQEGIPWTIESALDGFRRAAYRDWDDTDQAQFATLFRRYHSDPENDRALDERTG